MEGTEALSEEEVASGKSKQSKQAQMHGVEAIGSCRRDLADGKNAALLGTLR